MPKLLFRGANIRFIDVRFDEKSKTVYTKVNFTAAFSDPIREAMEWGQPPAGFASADLDGEMVATHFILTPNGRELTQHEIQLDARQIGAFKLFRVNNDDESTSNELRFQVTTAAPDAAALLAEYLRNIGKGEAQLRVNFEEQAKMDLEEGAGEDAQDSLAEGSEQESEGRLISAEQAADTAEESDAPLASVVTMGGSHQKGTRRKQKARNPEAEAYADGSSTEEIIQ